jgi:hypothetical protein
MIVLTLIVEFMIFKFLIFLALQLKLNGLRELLYISWLRHFFQLMLMNFKAPIQHDSLLFAKFHRNHLSPCYIRLEEI